MLSDRKKGINSSLTWGSLNPCSNGICSLTVSSSAQKEGMLLRLNPCSNGICSLTDRERCSQDQKRSLNPCSNGICSLTNTQTTWSIRTSRVLILVLMEYALWRLRQLLSSQSDVVLILVLMEYALWHFHNGSFKHIIHSLNPCSNGICSLTKPRTSYVWFFVKS